MNTKIELTYPLKIAGAEVSVLNLRRPKVRDLEQMDKQSGDIAKTVTLIANLAEITPEQVRELDAEDFAVVSEMVAGFLGNAPGPR